MNLGPMPVEGVTALTGFIIGVMVGFWLCPYDKKIEKEETEREETK